MTKKVLARPDLLTKISSGERALYEKALHHFMEHQGHGTNLEKLHGNAKYYSIRVNKGIRLILTPVKRNKKQVWLWVDTLDKHQYEHLKNDHWLAKQIEKTLEHDIEILPEHPEPGVLAEIQPDNGIEYHNQQFILFDESQKKAQDTLLPMLISGAPGSGKSSVALSLLRQFISKNPPVVGGERKRLLYVAQSEALVRNMQDEWQHIQAIEGIDPDAYDIEFKTPRQLFEQYYREREEIPPQLVEQDYFNDWFADYTTTQISLLPQAASSSKKKHRPSAEEDFMHHLAAHPELAYQEFRTISGYASFEQYNDNVGSKHSLFEHKNDRQWLWDAYQRYTERLHDKKVVDLFFHPILSNHPTHLVVVDEAQDLSRLILRSLDKIADNHQIAYCIGDHQRVHDSRSIFPFIKSIFWELAHKINVNHQPLKASYRCPERITQTANAILQLKYHATGETDKNELMFIHSSEHFEEPGSVHWLDKEEELKPLINDKGNAHFAVITSPEFKNEAIRLFGVERVFTAEEIKGLEYEHVLLYKLLDSKPYKAANQVIDEHLTLHDNPEGFSLPKSSSGSIRHNTAFNELFVAMTRAQCSVSVYQPESRAITKIRTPLKQFITSKDQPKAHAQATPTQSSHEEWARRAQMLRAQEQEEKARVIEANLAKKTEIASQPISKSKKNKLIISESEIQKAPTDTELIAEIIERNIMFANIMTGNIQALRKLLKHPKVEEYLFREDWVSPILCGSLFQWLIENQMTETLVQEILSLLKEMAKSPKKYTDSIPPFMKLLCHKEDTSTSAIEEKSVFSLLLIFFELEPNIISFIQQHIPKETLIDFFKTGDANGFTLIEFAIKHRAMDLINNIHHLIDLNNMTTLSGMTPVHLATMHEQIGLLIFFNKLGLKFDIPNNEGQTAIDYAVLLNSPLMITALTRLGIDIHIPNKMGLFPMHLAATGELDSLMKLHDLGANPNVLTPKRCTPAYFAAYGGHKDMITRLHELGADLTLFDIHGDTPAHVAARGGHIGVLLELHRLNIDVNTPNDSVATSL